MRGTEESSEEVCEPECVCARYQFEQEHIRLNGFLLHHLCIFHVSVSVCVHLRPLAPHHQV